jgi:hypothetical protein
MAWKKVAKDSVNMLSAEAGRHPYDRRLSDLTGELSTRMLLTYTAEPESPSQYGPRVSWPAGPRPPTASGRPPRLIPRRRLNRTGGLTDTGTTKSGSCWCSGAVGEACHLGAESPSTSVSRSMAMQAPRYRTPIAQSEKATFANGWLTKMIKAQLHSQQSGPD